MSALPLHSIADLSIMDGRGALHHSEFNDKDADVIVKSVDNTTFRLHRKYLDAHTRPGSFPESGNKVAILDETAEVLEILFQFVYPRRQPDLEVLDFNSVAAVAEAAEKYQVFSAMSVCQIRMRQFIPAHPAPVLAYALRHGYPKLITIRPLTRPTSALRKLRAASNMLCTTGPFTTSTCSQCRYRPAEHSKNAGSVKLAETQEQCKQHQDVHHHQRQHYRCRPGYMDQRRRWRRRRDKGGPSIDESRRCDSMSNFNNDKGSRYSSQHQHRRGSSQPPGLIGHDDTALNTSRPALPKSVVSRTYKRMSQGG